MLPLLGTDKTRSTDESSNSTRFQRQLEGCSKKKARCGGGAGADCEAIRRQGPSLIRFISAATADLEKLRFAGGVASVQLVISLRADRDVISSESSSVVERRRTIVEPSKRVGHCERTTISEIGYRAGQDSAVAFANGVYQAAYENIRAVHESRIGDPVVICVTDVEKWCPVNATPTITYRVINRRNRRSWEMSDSTKSCWHSFDYPTLY